MDFVASLIHEITSTTNFHQLIIQVIRRNFAYINLLNIKQSTKFGKTKFNPQRGMEKSNI